jgi:metallo-beta-lactamase class B
MLHNVRQRRRLVVVLAVLSVVALVIVGRLLNATKVGGQGPAEPFRIAGNFYYVGATDVAASEASADTLASGGDDPDLVFPLRVLIWIGVLGYPPPQVDQRFKDGDTIRVGPIALTAHITGGHTRGCTSRSFPVRDGDRVLNVVSVCDTGILGTSRYPEQRADRERSLRVLRSLPADIWVTNHARPWGRYRKFVASTTAKRNPVDAFIDPEGYRAHIDAAEAELRQGRVH